MTERHRYWCRSRDKPSDLGGARAVFPSPLLFLRRICFLIWLDSLWMYYSYGARTSGRSPWGGDTARRRFIGGGRGPLLS